MANEAQLVASLSVRLDKFEAEMKKAGLVADKGMKDIEDRFTRGNVAIGSAIGTVLGRAIGDGLRAGVRAIENLIERFKQLGETARITGLEMSQVFAFQQAGAAGGVGPEAINRALERMNTLLDQAKRGADNSLAKLFTANNLDVKNVRDIADLWQRVADLVRRAQTVEHGRQIAEAAGAGRELEKTLGLSAEQTEKIARLAESAAPHLNKLAELSEDFERSWKVAVSAIQEAFLQMWPEINRGFIAFLDTMSKGLENWSNDFGFKWAKTWSDAFNAMSGALAGTIGGSTSGALAGASAGKGVRLRPPGGFSKPPAIGGGGGGGADRLDAFEREERRATERAAAMEKEAQLVGATVQQRTFELEKLRLIQMAERERLPLTDALNQKIDATAQKYAKGAAVLEEANRKQAQFQQLQQFAGNTIVDALDRATEKGAKFADIMQDVASSIKRAAIQALILGQGPLAGLFSTGGAGGQTGGLIGLATNALGRRESGGPISAGRPYLVGERGPEIIMPRSAGTVIPRVGSNVTYAPVNQITAAPGVTPEQLAAVLDRHDQQFIRRLPQIARAADKRFG